VGHILASKNRALLERLIARRGLLAFDFDGTLAPIVGRPERAAMRARTRRLLVALASARPCAVVSGRALEDLRARVRGVPLLALAGNHGAEIAWGDGVPGRAGGRGRVRSPRRAAIARRVRAWRVALENDLQGIPGVWVEDKTISLTVHYRLARDVAGAGRAVRRAARALRGARLVGGKFGLNLLPSADRHKGTALRALWKRVGGPGALYVGDDATDEDVFVLETPGLVSVRVGRSRLTGARHHLDGQEEIDDLLETLLALHASAGEGGVRR
jgi:trehalose 6-phosphate phosphatase